MDEQTLKRIVGEVRQEFQIPPYFKDEGLMNYAKEGARYLLGKNPLGNLEEDETFRMLLKNYINYAYYHRVNEWETNYSSMILGWMLESEVTE